MLAELALKIIKRFLNNQQNTKVLILPQDLQNYVHSITLRSGGVGRSILPEHCESRWGEKSSPAFLCCKTVSSVVVSQWGRDMAVPLGLPFIISPFPWILWTSFWSAFSYRIVSGNVSVFVPGLLPLGLFLSLAQQSIPHFPHLHWANNLHQHIAIKVKGKTHHVVR